MTTADASPVPNYPDLLRLDGKGFIVRGAGQGMGRQVSHALRQVGAKVFCVDIDRQRIRAILAARAT
jgi:NAD(P)-dependent dehydrogenase (short-subunit alcohol dehydrogenase family)